MEANGEITQRQRVLAILGKEEEDPGGRWAEGVDPEAPAPAAAEARKKLASHTHAAVVTLPLACVVECSGHRWHAARVALVLSGASVAV